MKNNSSVHHPHCKHSHDEGHQEEHDHHHLRICLHLVGVALPEVEEHLLFHDCGAAQDGVLPPVLVVTVSFSRYSHSASKQLRVHLPVVFDLGIGNSLFHPLPESVRHLSPIWGLSHFILLPPPNPCPKSHRFSLPSIQTSSFDLPSCPHNFIKSLSFLPPLVHRMRNHFSLSFQN